ncbi:MAG: HisA/HisF-related TIM barrel protein, partial [Aridibacter sp.]
TTTELELIPFLKKYYAKGVRKVFVTDISKDGLLEGSAKDLYAEILENLPRLHLIASGGIDSIEDIAKLEKIGCAGAIIGKAIYEDRISLTKLSRGRFLEERRN